MKLRQALRQLRRAGWQRLRKRATAHAIWQRGPGVMVTEILLPL